MTDKDEPEPPATAPEPEPQPDSEPEPASVSAGELFPDDEPAVPAAPPAASDDDLRDAVGVVRRDKISAGEIMPFPKVDEEGGEAVGASLGPPDGRGAG